MEAGVQSTEVTAIIHGRNHGKFAVQPSSTIWQLKLRDSLFCEMCLEWIKIMYINNLAQHLTYTKPIVATNGFASFIPEASAPTLRTALTGSCVFKKCKYNLISLYLKTLKCLHPVECRKSTFLVTAYWVVHCLALTVLSWLRDTGFFFFLRPSDGCHYQLISS